MFNLHNNDEGFLFLTFCNINVYLFKVKLELLKHNPKAVGSSSPVQF